ncbi:Target of rapamycin complex 2 subunit avo2 [Elasticomyces elasticus]|nr:Target of rapamycin complex 2 subunit avo2 [Elasticomyces elasticus]
MLTAQRGQVEVGRLLIEQFPRCIPWANKQGMDALALASAHPASTPLLPYLLSSPTFPANPHSRDTLGNTPLHHASASGSLKALRILLSAGANSLAKNSYDWTPLAYSQTVAAEVYFKNLVAEFERRRVEGARQQDERAREREAQKRGGVRLVTDETGAVSVKRPGDIDVGIRDAQWSPAERRKIMTPTAGGSEVWHGSLGGRARASSDD